MKFLLRLTAEQTEPDADFELLNRLVPFAMSENGDYLFWDTGSGTVEMDIFITDFGGSGFVRAAKNLYEFFDKVTSPTRFREVFPLFRGAPLPAIFEPLAKM